MHKQQVVKFGRLDIGWDLHYGLNVCVFHVSPKGFHLQAFFDNFLTRVCPRRTAQMLWTNMDKVFYVKFDTQLEVPSTENEANQQLLTTLWQLAQQGDFTHLKVMMMVEQMQKTKLFIFGGH